MGSTSSTTTAASSPSPPAPETIDVWECPIASLTGCAHVFATELESDIHVEESHPTFVACPFRSSLACYEYFDTLHAARQHAVDQHQFQGLIPTDAITCPWAAHSGCTYFFYTREQNATHQQVAHARRWERPGGRRITWPSGVPEGEVRGADFPPPVEEKDEVMEEPQRRRFFEIQARSAGAWVESPAREQERAEPVDDEVYPPENYLRDPYKTPQRPLPLSEPDEWWGRYEWVNPPRARIVSPRELPIRPGRPVNIPEAVMEEDEETEVEDEVPEEADEEVVGMGEYEVSVRQLEEAWGDAYESREDE
ncbi:uncharacterized protein K452DRAFT_311983 [Aplosporella prunicola CBS 121167]|uniref:Uncharacterized protein n=1 Tax=Aplosporella prunicola CBS 121167 TaxID=1176127 RepID=A0A6A6B3R2_9PEZI|nr:uncharacterized protein K452DRAFT_311983 [Aplosporella prunicola CBS 121167]KAF2137844.1 hypothetical protein K452DRAFT_311983 [Aplosporella prunicola CBS 121167]